MINRDAKIITRKIFKVGIFRFRICIWGVKFNGGIDIGEGGRERDGDLVGDSNMGGGEGDLGGGGEGDLGGSGDLGGGDCDVEGHGEGDRGGGDLCLFSQARRVVGESGGRIGIAGEPTHCSVSVFFS